MILRIKKYFPKKRSTELILILSLSLFSALTYNLFSTNPLPLIYKPIKLETGSYLSIEQTLQIFNKREAIFIDARKPDEFNAGHIKDAINIPVQLSRSEKIKQLKIVSKDKNIIIYCGNPLCNSAERLAGEMEFLGYKHVAIFMDGWENWPFSANSQADK